MTESATPNNTAAVVIPCYNEEHRLDTAAVAAFAKQHPEVTFVLFDDGSTDGTLAMLNHLAEQAPESFHVKSAEANGGKAEAVRQGVLYATELPVDLVGFWDADLATPLEDIALFMKKFRERPALNYVTGARLKRLGCDVSRKLSRHYLGRVFATLISMKLNLPVYDSQCGAKLMRRELAAQVFAKKFVTRWFFDVEILKRLTELNGRENVIATTLEQPVSSWRDVDQSKVKMSAALFQLLEILMMK